MDLFNYSRRQATEVNIGATPMGGANPIRIQSMTNTVTMDTEACVEQAKRIIDAGGEYVRMTTQGVREAENMMNINIGLRSQGYDTPLVADVHFNPNVADVAAQYVEKVRINPGNYVDAARTFKKLEYTDEEYALEIEKIRARLVPFLNICKENHTAIRIGVNHGSLSDRIMSRYGDTPEGMVESCMEFLRICVAEQFMDVVISIKASNTVVMVKTVRLLAAEMEKEGMAFPLHLGVTEAGDGEDGRIKSALGIGALLADGLGDTIRVSLSEAPEAEIPVARKLVNYILEREEHPYIPGKVAEGFNYLSPTRRETVAVKNIGGDNLPIVISERLDESDEVDEQFKPDYIYCGQTLPKNRREDIAYIVDANDWNPEDKNVYPAFNYQQMLQLHHTQADLKFLFLPYMALNREVIAALRIHPEVVIIAQSSHINRLGEFRGMIHEMREMQVMNMGQYAHGNQPIQHMAYLYNYTGQPWKAQQRIREVMDKLYSSAPDGYCGDEDNGQTSAWYVFSSMGFYPVCPGSGEYALGTPLFKKMTVTLSDGKKIRIEAPSNSRKNFYVDELKVNGKKYDRNYVTMEQLKNGAELIFDMSAAPNTRRGASEKSAPYSFSKE